MSKPTKPARKIAQETRAHATELEAQAKQLQREAKQARSIAAFLDPQKSTGDGIAAGTAPQGQEVGAA